MKKLTILAPIVAVSGLLAIAAPASAGTLTITSGPNFTPASAFTDNTIQVEVFSNPPGVMGDLARLSGDATITPDASNSVMIEIAGTYAVNAGDLASGAYSFTIDLNVPGPVTYTVSGTATLFGSPQTFSASGDVMPGLHQYKGKFKAPAAFPFATSGNFSAALKLNFGSASAKAAALAAAPGTLKISIQNPAFQVAPTEAAAAAPSQPLNISTRLAVETGDNVLIGGFIITGTDPKKVLVRAIGPSLSSGGQPVPGRLQDPTLELHAASTTLATNDNWKTRPDGSSQQAEIEATTIPPTNDLESALVVTLTPGDYTAILAGQNQTTGIGVVEVYDLDQAANSKLANISTRGFVQTGNNVLIGGFVLGPDSRGASSVVVRAIGPSLAAAGVPNPLQNPTLELHSGDGTLIASNDNWMDGSDRQTIQDNGLAPTDGNESALLAIPSPGNFTVIVKGVSDAIGVAVVEVYHLQ